MMFYGCMVQSLRASEDPSTVEETESSTTWNVENFVNLLLRTVMV